MHTLDKLKAKHPDKIEGWYKDMDGYWVDLKYGWQDSPSSEVHAVHEPTVKEVVEHFKLVCPCDCLYCQTRGEQWLDFDVDTGKTVVMHRQQ